jgi:hypothetical protein
MAYASPIHNNLDSLWLKFQIPVIALLYKIMSPFFSFVNSEKYFRTHCLIGNRKYVCTHVAACICAQMCGLQKES